MTDNYDPGGICAAGVCFVNLPPIRLINEWQIGIMIQNMLKG